MKTMLKLIDLRKKEIEKHQLCQWMSDTSVPAQERLSFVPSMLFFIMGFSDILKIIKIKNPETPLHHIINTHCDEDADHWRWYLKDIERLGFTQNDWGGNLEGIFKKLWSDELFDSRKLVYESIRYATNAKDPVMRLLLIEVMEATFGAFTIHMIHPLKETDLYKKLQFFGHTHEHAEDNHSLGSWTSDQSPEEFMNNIVVEESLRYEATAMVEHLFDLFEDMFTCWYEERGTITNMNPNMSEDATAVSTQTPS